MRSRVYVAVHGEGGYVPLDDVRAAFEVDESIVSALKGAHLDGTTSADRQRLWAKQDGRRDRYIVEFLLPRVVRRIERAWPAFTDRPHGMSEFSNEQLVARIKALGKWTVPWPLGRGMSTLPDNDLTRTSANAILFRRDLINGTIAALLGPAITDKTVLDLGCNSGFFSFDLAERGAQQVSGIDLRAENVAQALFLAKYYGMSAVEFATADVDTFRPGEQWDIVLNLGVLYHVTDPFGLIRRTYELCREFAVIDTSCHPEPVAAYLLRGEKDVTRPVEGRDEIELHPTYRAAIQTIRAAGFSEVVEIVGVAELPHPGYERGVRRCFLAMK
jgi:2-polyprenyl-3-methyl-5-hydroxy-6-metoxy-1,4-benzoquinol methylase